jgi:hypothetical protein
MKGDADSTPVQFETARSIAYKRRMGDFDRALGLDDTRGYGRAARVARKALQGRPIAEIPRLKLDDTARASAARSIAIADGSDIRDFFRGVEPSPFSGRQSR